MSQKHDGSLWRKNSLKIHLTLFTSVWTSDFFFQTPHYTTFVIVIDSSGQNDLGFFNSSQSINIHYSLPQWRCDLLALFLQKFPFYAKIFFDTSSLALCEQRWRSESKIGTVFANSWVILQVDGLVTGAESQSFCLISDYQTGSATPRLTVCYMTRSHLFIFFLMFSCWA